MKTPWVPRVLYDEMRAEYRERIAALEAELRELTGTALQMRREGFVPTPPVSPLALPELGEETVAALAQSTDLPPAMLAHLRSYALRQQAMGASDHDIAARILKGE